MAEFRRMMMLAIFSVVCTVTPVLSQELAVLSGRVLDKATRSPVPGAYIVLDSTHLGTTADADGYYQLEAIPPGTYEISVGISGYASYHGEMRLTGGQKHVLTIELREMLYQMNPVTVTATRERSLVSEVPSSVDVVPLRDLQQRTIQNVGEAIESLQGVFAKNYGPIGALRTASLRGSNPNQVLILLDGQRLNDAQLGDVDLGGIPVEAVEQVEVVRGGSSALYGADALGGVINVVTKSKPSMAGYGASASMLSGSFGTRAVGFSSTYSAEQFFSLLSYKYLRSNGDFTYNAPLGNELSRRNADMLSHEVFGKGSWNFGDGEVSRSISLSGEYFLSRAGVPGTSDLPNALARQENLRQSVNLVYEQKGHDLFNGVRVQSYVHNLGVRYDDPEAYVPIHSDDRNTSWGAEVQGRLLANDWNRFTMGYVFRGDYLSAGSSLGAQHRSQHSIYLQNELSILVPESTVPRKLVAIPALRWDRFSDFGNRASPKIGILVVAGEVWQAAFKANVGTSFRSPSFNDLYWPKDNYSEGNPNLKPERGTDYDVGIMFRHPLVNGLAADVTYFKNVVNDLILWQEYRPNVWSPENIGRAAIQGVETRLSLNPLRDVLHLEWNYTYLDARNRTSNAEEFNRQLPYRPKYVHNVSARVELSGVYCILSSSQVAERFTTTSNTVSLPTYRVTNILIGVRRAFEPLEVGVKLEIRNAENLRYQALEGFPMPGREIRFSFEGELFHVAGSQ